MRGAIVFGFVLGLAIPFMTEVPPQPAGSIVFFAAMATYMTWGGIRMWRRTGLLFISAAVFLAALTSVLIAVAVIIGYRFPSLPWSWALPLYSLNAIAIVLGMIEQWRHPDAWKRWRRHMEHMGARDVFMGRHIPDLRHRT